MPMEFVAARGAGVATATMNVQLPAGTQVGDICVLLWHVDQGNFVSAGAGWTALHAWSRSGRPYYKRMATEADLTQANNFVLGGTAAFEQYYNIMSFRGGDPALNAPPFSAVNIDSTDSTPEVPNVTAVNPDAAHAIFAFIPTGSSTITGWPAGYTAGTQVSEGGDGISYSRYKILDAPGLVSGLTLTQSSGIATCDVYSILIEPLMGEPAPGLFFGNNY